MMKKCYILFFTLLCVCLSSCSDDVPNEKHIIGKWQLISSTDKEEETCSFSGYIEFQNNGKYIEKITCNSNGDGAWSIKDDHLIVTANKLPIPVVFNIKSLTGKELVLEVEGIDWVNNDLISVIYRYTYKKIN